MQIRFKHFSEFPGWGLAPEFLLGLQCNHNSKSILEIGSGANPTLTESDLNRLGIAYTTNDISLLELDKASPSYKRLCLDLSESGAWKKIHDRYDLVFSRMVNEHVKDGREYYENIYNILKPGGISAHCFSTLYSLPFTINRLLPESVSSHLLNVFCARDRYKQDKFKAYYSWSRGPSIRSVNRFQDIGFEVMDYTGYFGHFYYQSKLAPLHRLEEIKARYLTKHPISFLTSYAHVVLRKPPISTNPRSKPEPLTHSFRSEMK